MKKLIIFDLDGVLFDSKKNMEISWKNVMKTYKIKKKFTQYFKFVGLPFEAILKNLKISKNDISGISKFYNKISLKNQNKIKLYNNVRYTLNRLKKRKIKIGIVTSKNKIRTLKLIKKFCLKFDIIVAKEPKFIGKPHPDQINFALKKLNIKKKNAVYVGDMKVDYNCANKAKIKFIYASYGYGKKFPYYKNSIKNIKDIFKILYKIF